MEEAAKMAGLHVKVDTILNGSAYATDLFAGNYSAVFREGVKVAKSAYATRIPNNVDVVVANTYFKSNEATLAIWLAAQAVKEGGTIVLIANAPDGQVTHYLYGKFGRLCGGTLYSGHKHCARAGKFIIYSQYKIRDPFLPILEPNEQVLLTNWDEVLEEIRNTHSGTPRVAVFPTTEVQIPPKEIQ